MESTGLTIRRLEGEADAALYREIRLESLRASPEAFGSDDASESALPFEHFVTRLSDSHVFGAFRGGALVGIAGFAVARGVKSAHKGFLWGVYVRPRARANGVARKLIEAALTAAAVQVELIQLTVERGNLSARRLYTNLGFSEYGLEKNARKIGDHYVDDILMAKPLAR
jgi:ribosomal protein S18 acetylase RimI-like enzyme